MRQAETTVRSLLARADFRRLLATRLSAQFGDGVLQAALAGTVLFAAVLVALVVAQTMTRRFNPALY